MSYVDTFRPRQIINEEEVFELYKKPREIEELQPSRFEGPMVEWANERARDFGDTIISRFVHVESLRGKDHRVGYLDHAGKDPEDETGYHYHHIACDCILEAYRYGAEELIFTCEALITTLKKRAWQVSQKLGTEEILRSIPELPKEALYGKNRTEAKVEFGIRTIATILEHDARHPEDWIGNVIQHQHELSLMQFLMNYDLDFVKKCVGYLEDSDYIELEGETIRLEENILTEILDNKVRRENDDMTLRLLEREWADQILAENEAA